MSHALSKSVSLSGTVRPRTPQQLRAYVRAVLGFDIPSQPLIEGHASPFDYLCHAYFEDRQPRDCIVWANRGGGKTQLGAIATLLDMLFKPGIQVRILAGSFEQSTKMYRYLKEMLEHDHFRDLISGRLTGRAVELVNGSRVEVLSQSECAVRGQRVHKLRCDEVELFDPDIWEAAQLITRSGQCGDVYVNAAIETLSTMHRPYGMMQRLVDSACEQSRVVFQWSIVDTLERCPPQRPCETCALFTDCRGSAKQARGFVRIDDAVQQYGRVSSATWKAEMLCQTPSRRDSVYPEFDIDVHVIDVEPALMSDGMWIAGMDFGFRAPTVLLWGWVDRSDTLFIVDELVVEEMITEQQIMMANARAHPRPMWIGADPAGHQRSDQSGISTIALWRSSGWPVRTRRTSIADGINTVSRRLRRADGSSTLFIHRRCQRLIESLVKYHYPTDQPHSLTPVKDGHDHACDALRYLITNLDRDTWKVRVRTY